MSIVLAAVTLIAFLCAVSTSPWQVFIFRLLQGLVGGFVPIGLSVIASVSPEEETSRTLGYFQAAMVSGIMFGLLWEVLWRTRWGTACPLSSLAFCP